MTTVPQHHRQTDRQTDGRTTSLAIPRFARLRAVKRKRRRMGEEEDLKKRRRR